MKTLLKIEESDTGRLYIDCAPCPPVRKCSAFLDKLIIAIRDSSWYARTWSSLMGIAQQMLDLGIASSYEEEDYYCDYYDDYYEPEPDEEPFPLPKPIPTYFNPEKDPEWQRKRLLILERLKSWRQETADRKGLNTWEVLKHVALDNISRAMPANHKELMKVRLIGERTCSRYGEEILTIVQSVLELPAEAGTEEEAEAGETGDGETGVAQEGADTEVQETEVAQEGAEMAQV